MDRVFVQFSSFASVAVKSLPCLAGRVLLLLMLGVLPHTLVADVSVSYLEVSGHTTNGHSIDGQPADGKSIDIEQIAAGDSIAQFSKIESTPTLDFNAEHWFRVELGDYYSNPMERWYLVIGFPNIDAAQVYASYGGRIEAAGEIGDDIAFVRWPVSTRLPTIALYNNNQLADVVYLKLAATGQPAVLPLSILDESSLRASNQRDYLWYGIFFGACLALILYNLLLYVNTRIASHLPYVLYLTSFTLLQASITGIGQQFLWPTLSGFTTDFALWLIAVTNSMMSVFVCSFLDLRNRQESAYKGLMVVAAVALLIPFGLLFVEYIHIQNILHVYVLVTMLCITYIAWRELRAGSRPAMYLLISYVFLFAGIVMSLLYFNGKVKSGFFTQHFMELAILFEAFILSLGLTDKINELKAQSQNMAKKALQDQTAFTQKLIAAHESEKQRFGAILHDDIGHGVLMLQESVNTHLPDSQPLLQNHWQNINTRIGDILEQVQHLSRSSHPYLLAQLGLSKAVQSMVHTACENADLEYACHVDKLEFGESGEQQIYRIIQELVSNTIKHAGASEILINIRREGEKACILYKDDGCGFDARHTNGALGFGVVSIRERARLLGAAVSMQSTANSGFECRIDGIALQ